MAENIAEVIGVTLTASLDPDDALPDGRGGLILSSAAPAQDDLMDFFDAPTGPEVVTSTFKAGRIVNVQSRRPPARR